MKKKLLPIFCSVALSLSLPTTVMAEEIHDVEEVMEEENQITATDEKNIDDAEESTESSENETMEENTESENEEYCEEETIDIENYEYSEDENTEEIKTNSKNELDAEQPEEESESEAEIDEEDEPTEILETTCTTICHINISYEKDVYVIENLCPTGEIKTINLDTNLSIESGQDLSTFCDETSTDIRLIIDSIDDLSLPIENSFDVNAHIDADGNITINNVEKSEPENIDCEVLVYENEAEDEDELEEELGEELKEELEGELEEELEEELEREPETEPEVDDSISDELKDEISVESEESEKECSDDLYAESNETEIATEVDDRIEPDCYESSDINSEELN